MHTYGVWGVATRELQRGEGWGWHAKDSMPPLDSI